MPALTTNPVSTLRRLAVETPLIRRSTAITAGVSSSAISRLVRSGELLRVGRCLYQLAEEEGYGHADLVEVAVQVPKGVIALLSALGYHGVGTHSARDVWLQLPAKTVVAIEPELDVWIGRQRRRAPQGHVTSSVK